MIYIQFFTLPSQESEENYLNDFYCCSKSPESNYYDTLYPFTIFPAISLRKIHFDHIIIFYGGNGSGKSILLNILSQRVKREQIQVKANMLIKRNTVLKYDVESSLKVSCHLDFETGENVRKYIDFVKTQKESYSSYIKDKLGNEEPGLSNGENSFFQLSQLMEDEGVYILDEPENSLSPEMQYNVSQLILYIPAITIRRLS